jgi:acyl carrier protein
MSIVRERFLKILSDCLGIPADEIIDSDTLEGLGTDSLDKIDIIIDCEDIFSIDIPESNAQKLINIGEFINYIENEIK